MNEIIAGGTAAATVLLHQRAEERRRQGLAPDGADNVGNSLMAFGSLCLGALAGFLALVFAYDAFDSMGWAFVVAIPTGVFFCTALAALLIRWTIVLSILYVLGYMAGIFN